MSEVKFRFNGHEVIVDEEDYLTARKYISCVTTSRQNKPAAVRLLISDLRIYLHRFLLNAPKGVLIDHINGNPLDNRKCNLRMVTVAQNNMNSAVGINKKSGLPKGVYFRKDKKDKQFTAYLGFMGTRMHLGFFNTAKEAEDAYLKAAEFYYPEHAHHVSKDKIV